MSYEISEEFVSPVFRVSYPELWIPKLPKDPKPEAKKRYTVSAIFDEKAQADPKFAQMKAEAGAVRAKLFGADFPGDVRGPFRKGETRVKKGTTNEFVDGYGPGKMFCALSANEGHAMEIYNMQKELVDPEDPLARRGVLYGGCFARAIIQALAYDTGGNGVKFAMTCIQMVADGPSFSGGTNAGGVLLPDDLPLSELPEGAVPAAPAAAAPPEDGF